MNEDETSSVFLHFFVHHFSTRALTHPFSCVLRLKNYFSAIFSNRNSPIPAGTIGTETSHSRHRLSIKFPAHSRRQRSTQPGFQHSQPHHNTIPAALRQVVNSWPFCRKFEVFLSEFLTIHGGWWLFVHFLTIMRKLFFISNPHEKRVVRAGDEK